MKYFALSLFVIMSMCSADAQSSNLDHLLDKHYKGDKSDFLEQIYTTVRYPRLAMENCVMVKITATVHVDESGTITDIVQSPRMSYGFEAAISEALEQTKGRWKEGEALIPISFGFVIDDEEILADINVKAYKTGHLVGCLSREMLLDQVNKYAKKEKFKKSQKSHRSAPA